MNLKLYGNFRSCTNITKHMVEAAFPSVRVWHHGTAGHPAFHKHGLPKQAPGMDGYLLCIKHPVAWMGSVNRYRPTDPRFLALWWNTHTEALCNFLTVQDRAMLVRHEDWLEDSGLVLRKVRATFHLAGDTNISLPTQAAARGGDNTAHTLDAHPFDAEPYQEKRWWGMFGKDITDLIDRDLMAEVGYHDSL